MGKLFGPGGLANAGVMGAKLREVVDAIKAEGGVEKFGVVGYCWGAKVSAKERARSAANGGRLCRWGRLRGRRFRWRPRCILLR
jgi:hypothetical protein